MVKHRMIRILQSVNRLPSLLKKDGREFCGNNGQAVKDDRERYHPSEIGGVEQAAHLFLIVSCLLYAAASTVAVVLLQADIDGRIRYPVAGEEMKQAALIVSIVLLQADIDGRMRYPAVGEEMKQAALIPGLCMNALRNLLIRILRHIA